MKAGKMKTETGGESRQGKHPTLEDVTPMHPYEYPARHMKERLDARRDMLDDIEEKSHPTGFPDGAGR
ncbi:MAG: hypothetical protein JWO30_2112 [Fibrobacteres bacterium]|nr:hypothetical protein [Fibrobacterota bacterium]